MALPRLRLHTQLLLAMLGVAFVLTIASLLTVRQSVQSEVHQQTAQGLADAVETFQRVQSEQGAQLSRTAALVAELPTLKALMTTDDRATVQEASQSFWKTTGEDLLVLAGRDGRILGVHANSQAVNFAAADQMLKNLQSRNQQRGWWRVDSELYHVVLQPIVAGAGTDAQFLGILVIGRQMNTASAEQLARLAGSEIALVAGNAIVASTLNGQERDQFQRALESNVSSANLRLGGRPFDAASVPLDTESGTTIRCWVLFSLDAEYALLDRLNRTIALLGFLAIIAGVVVIILISGAITRPVEDLVRAVRALAMGDYAYSIRPSGSAEIAELGAAFNHMRHQVSESQRKQLQAERLAALGRAAGSISHDLRHYLATVLANAEFLREADTLGFNRSEIYREIERASAQMTDMIDSLVEIARDRNPIHPVEARLDDVARRAIDNIRSSPDLRNRNIDLVTSSATEGYFDGRKIERALFNLILNACEATSTTPNPRVGIDLDADDGMLECCVWDNGPGVPAEIERTLFEPFVSAGKNNGTGLGLAIASKIVHDHGGEIVMERSSAGGAAFRIRIPRRAVVADRQDAANLSA
jgi:signal transduction histidine kinase